MSATALTVKGFPAQCQTTVKQSHHSSSQKTNRLDQGNVGAWPRLAQNQIYVVPQNQAKTMNANTEPNTAPKVTNGRIDGKFAPGFSGNPGGSPEATRRAFNKGERCLSGCGASRRVLI